MATKRGPRSARACDHCRLKRLKCNDELRPEGCMNCLIYNTKCEYTKYTGSPNSSAHAPQSASRPTQYSAVGSAHHEAAPPVSRKRHRASNSTNTSPESETARQTHLVAPTPPSRSTGETNNFIPPNASASKSLSPPKSTHASSIIFEHALDKRYSLPPVLTPPETDTEEEQLENMLSSSMIPLLVGSPEQDGIPDVANPETAGLPSRDTTGRLIELFFENVYPLYPVVDKTSFRTEIQQFKMGQTRDKLWLVVFKLVMVVGFRSNDNTAEEDRPLNYCLKSLFQQAITSVHLAYQRADIVSAQALLLIVLHSIQTKRTNSAWIWCGSAIRVLRALKVQRNPLDANAVDDSLMERLLWTAYILEGQLCLAHYRDDIQMRDMQPLSQGLREAFPIVYMRAQLARLMHRFCKLFEPGTLIPGNFPDQVLNLHCDIIAWRDSIPEGYRPESDLFVEPQEHQFILLVHVDYHSFLHVLFSALGAAARHFPNLLDLDSHPSIKIRSHARLRTSSARRLLQSLDAIVDSPHLRPCVTSWIHPIHILPAFSTLYSGVITRPDLLSATSNVELLKTAAKHFQQHMIETSRNKAIADLIGTMTLAASDRVRHAHGLNGRQSLSSFSHKPSTPTTPQFQTVGFLGIPSPRSFSSLENEPTQTAFMHKTFATQRNHTSAGPSEGQIQEPLASIAVPSQNPAASSQTFIQPCSPMISIANYGSQTATKPAEWDDLDSILNMEMWDGLKMM